MHFVMCGAWHNRHDWTCFVEHTLCYNSCDIPISMCVHFNVRHRRVSIYPVIKHPSCTLRWCMSSIHICLHCLWTLVSATAHVVCNFTSIIFVLIVSHMYGHGTSCHATHNSQPHLQFMPTHHWHILSTSTFGLNSFLCYPRVDDHEHRREDHEGHADHEGHEDHAADHEGHEDHAAIMGEFAGINVSVPADADIALLYPPYSNWQRETSNSQDNLRPFLHWFSNVRNAYVAPWQQRKVMKANIKKPTEAMKPQTTNTVTLMKACSAMKAMKSMKSPMNANKLIGAPTKTMKASKPVRRMVVNMAKMVKNKYMKVARKAVVAPHHALKANKAWCAYIMNWHCTVGCGIRPPQFCVYASNLFAPRSNFMSFG